MIREELKKIWRPSILIALLLLGFVFYTMYLSFYITYFPNGPQYDGVLRVAEEWITKYGTSLEPEEEAEAAASIAQMNVEADNYLSKNSYAQENGLRTYEEFETFYEENVFEVSGELSDEQWTRHEDAHRILNYLQGAETNNIDGRLYATNVYTELYKLWEENGADFITRAYEEDYTEREYTHAVNTFFGEDNAWQNILPSEVPQATSTYFGYLLIWMALSVCLLLSPLLVQDRMRGMRSLQWSSRRGRKILNVQFAAAMLSTVLLTTLNLTIFGGLFATNGTSIFINCRLFSFMHTYFAWFNCTYGVWCIILVAMSYLVSIGVAAFAFFLSRYSRNYVAMLLKLIPLFVLTAILCPKLMEYTFYYSNSLYQMTGIPGIEAIMSIFIFLLGIMLCIIACHRQKKHDLLIE